MWFRKSFIKIESLFPDKRLITVKDSTHKQYIFAVFSLRGSESCRYVLNKTPVWSKVWFLNATFAFLLAICGIFVIYRGNEKPLPYSCWHKSTILKFSWYSSVTHKVFYPFMLSSCWLLLQLNNLIPWYWNRLIVQCISSDVADILSLEAKTGWCEPPVMGFKKICYEGDSRRTKNVV